jgi:hypothetical protein
MGIEEMNGLEDADSADILTEISHGIDKWLWFVEAHQQSALEEATGEGRPRSDERGATAGRHGAP